MTATDDIHPDEEGTLEGAPSLRANGAKGSLQRLNDPGNVATILKPGKNETDSQREQDEQRAPHLDDASSPAAPPRKPTAKRMQPIRAINEDDDGYDPYTDLHDRPWHEPLFERNPWD